MLFGKKTSSPTPPSAAPQSEDQELQSVTQNLYKQNLELAVKNKTLSLLSKLYGISIQALRPDELAIKIVSIIQEDFEFEQVGLLSYDKANDFISELAFAESNRFHNARFNSKGFFDALILQNASTHKFFGPLLSTRQMGYAETLKEVWDFGPTPEQLDAIQAGGHVRSLLAYPLVVNDEIIGVFTLTLNRILSELVDYEKESIRSFINVISVALDKARLYEELTISNEKLAEANDRLKQLDQMKNEFLSVASHQLRAPITAIKGYVANILEDSYGVVPDSLKDPLGVIQESTRVMVSSIEDYLNVSRIEQGRMKYEMAPVEITKLAERATTELTPLAEKKGITLSFAPSPDLTITADFGKIKQVFTNLIDNAIKYTEKGSVTVSITTDGTNMKFMTSDTGMGISAEDIPTLFDKFIRARGANQVNTTGTGLGLYVAKNLVDGHGGTIHIESDGPGKGSRFIVELPLVPKTA